jgi:MFS transporter, DHA3 family, macrolide efflux protein
VVPAEPSGWAVIRSSPVLPGLLVIAARSALLIIAAPVGTALGGPIVAALGARGTLLASALATVALALITAAILALPRCRRLLSRDRNAKAMDRSAEPPASEG